MEITIKQFYLICLIGVSSIGGLVLLSIWRQINKVKKGNKSLLFISLALFSWTVVGIYKYYDPPVPSLVHAINDRILSAFSNLFLLAALPYFTNVFTTLKERFLFFRNPEQWVINVFIFFTVITVIFTLIDRNVESDAGKKAIIALDSVISSITMLSISYSLFKSVARFWKDKMLLTITLLALGVLISTQIFLPLIAIFPEQLKSFYLIALISLLLGLIYLIFITISYAGMLLQEIQVGIIKIENEEPLASKEMLPIAITVGFNEQNKTYFIRITFSDNNSDNNKDIEITSTKLLQPFANWVLFVIAKQNNIALSHPDLAIVKFRMIEYWNKNSNVHISQDKLFVNDRGYFELNLQETNVNIENTTVLKSKYIIRETVYRYVDSFSRHIELTVKGKISKDEQMVQLLDKLTVK